ncbi:MAG: hypothetical protein HY314_11695 [Acidobacteria bacterium]|nr:hypothetical protein [Acidobacteriota bacterium]
MDFKKAATRYKWLIFPVIAAVALATVYAVRGVRSPPAESPSPAATTTGVSPESSKPVASRSIIIPAGTVIRGSLLESLSTEATRTGQSFSLRVPSPVVIDGVTVVPAGSRIIGTVAESRRSGRVKGRARMVLSFRKLETSSGEYSIAARHAVRVAPGTKKRDAAIIGAGAGIGAAIGAVAGGKKGAVIGAATGGGAGTGVVLATRGKPTGFRRGETIRVKLVEPVRVMVS